jgi:hypothetical protein
MNIVTVAFDRDFDQLLLQADSMNKFLKTKSTHWVVVESTDKTEAEWETLLTPLYTFHKLKLIFLGPLTSEYEISGYIRQQIFKLTISNYIEDDYYLVLDCKNFFVRDTYFNFDDEEGNRTLRNISDVKNHERFKILKHVIEQDLKKTVPVSTWATITPFRIKTSTARRLVKELNLTALAKGPWVNEFLLYSIYSDYPIEKSQGKPCYFFTWWSDTQLSIDVFQNQDITIFGCHKFFINNNSNQALIDKIKEFLYNTGLEKRLIDNYFFSKYSNEYSNSRV